MSLRFSTISAWKDVRFFFSFICFTKVNAKFVLFVFISISHDVNIAILRNTMGVLCEAGSSYLFGAPAFSFIFLVISHFVLFLFAIVLSVLRYAYAFWSLPPWYLHFNLLQNIYPLQTPAQVRASRAPGYHFCLFVNICSILSRLLHCSFITYIKHTWSKGDKR